MKIAVTYENGQVFQHFGHTETFKLYEVQDGAVVSSELLNADGTGHEALAGLLAERKVDVLLCGGMGGGAQSALAEAGIQVVSGVQGDADEAVAAYLRGELESAGVNCDHHHKEAEEQPAEGGCGGHCGGGCGGCPGHCGGPSFEGPNVGKTCRVHYRGTLNDGTQFDSSYDRNEPLVFECGAGMMIPGFDAAVAVMEVGETKDIHLMPEEAYGYADPRMIFTVEVSQLPGSEDLAVGAEAYLYDTTGRPVRVTVTAREGGSITFDANHPMAGKELNFRIELVEVI